MLRTLRRLRQMSRLSGLANLAPSRRSLAARPPPARLRQPDAAAALAGAAPADVEDLLRLARSSFVRMQAAWDRGDLLALGRVATAPLLEDLRTQLAGRGPLPNHTEVVTLDARLLAIEELHEAFVASVEFSGLIRERGDDAAAPFRELWLLARLKSADRDWKLARVQSLS